MHKTIIALAVSFVALSGCSFEDSAAPWGHESLYERLGTREFLSLQQPSLIGVAAYDRDGEPLPCVQPDVVSGTAAMRTTEDGTLLVEGISIYLTDITIEPGVVLPDEPLQLTDVRLRLGTQIAIDTEWNGDRATGSGRGDLLMDWAILDDSGKVLPLATQKIRDAELLVDVSLADGEVHADVTSAVDGTFWDFSAVELADFSMAVSAKSGAPE